jgi:branched-chain amino acid transport system substrate-binding protein
VTRIVNEGGSMIDRRPNHRTRARSGAAIVLVMVLALVAAACSGNRSTAKPATTSPSGSTGATTSSTIIDTSACPSGSETTGVTGNTITIGTSVAQSGTYAPFSAILDGESAYLDYTNANGGVTIAGKKYKIKLVAKDDAYVASRTVTNVQSLLTDNHVFALLNVVGTKNNLAIRDLVNRECVPDLFAASGATQWGNHKFPWLIGSELVPYPLEVKRFVDYLKVTKPNATIALLKADDDFGQSYADTLTQLVKGTQLKIVKTEQYDSTGAEVATQVNNLAATKADVFFLGATLLACPAALTAASAAGWHPITYMSGTCVSKVLFSIAGPPANGVFSVTPLLDPADPKNANEPAMKLYKAQVAKFKPKADLLDGIVGYGWTTGALLVKTLESAKAADRFSVMEAARTLKNVTGVGLQIPAAKWNTSANDWFIGETFQFIKYDQAAGHTDPIGPLTDDDGKTAELTPAALINQ